MSGGRGLLPGVVVLLGCHGPPAAGVQFSDLTATVSDVIPTVVTVVWTTDMDTRSRVLFKVDEREFATPLEGEAGTEHTAVLLGLPGGTDVEWKVVLDDGNESPSQQVTTGNLSNTLPSLSVSGAHDHYTVTTLLGGVTGPAIVSPEGEFVWFYEDTRGLDVYRARLSNDKASVLYNAASVSGDAAEESMLVRVSLDGSIVSETPVPFLAHDFVELDDGSLVALTVELRDDDADASTPAVRGDRLVSLPLGDDGSGLSERRSSWDCFDPALDIGTDPEAGWTFANALDYDAEGDDGAGAFLLSLRNFSSITHIPRLAPTDGPRCDWTLGATAATLAPDVPFLHQHQFELIHATAGSGEAADTVLVFDNAGAGSASRAIEYRLDPAMSTATKVWEYAPDPPLFTFVLGDVARLAGGDTVVDFAVSGELDRVNAEGEVVWRLNTALGYGFGFMTQVQALY